MTLRQKYIKYMLDHHIGTLQHFIEEGGWPIKDNDKTFNLLSNRWLCRTKNGLLARNKSHPIPDDLLAAYWEFRFKEEQENYIKLANAVEAASKLI